MIRLVPFALACLVLTPLVSAQIVKTVLDSGSTETRYDMVVLGDGYQVTEQTKFDADVQKFVDALVLEEPYKTYAAYINVHSVFRASVDSGADHPDVVPPLVRDTVYGASYNVGGTARCLYISNHSQATADAALAPANEGRILIFVNDSRYGGCAGSVAVSYNGSSMANVQIHEIGHSIGQLADEYDYPNDTYTGSEPSQVNVTTSSVGQKWSHWWGYDGISAFEGARYYRYGIYRPRSNCMMRSLGANLCSVCVENTILKLHGRATAIDQPLPAEINVEVARTVPQAFSFTSIAPPSANAAVSWSLDGQQVQQGGTSWTLDASGLSVGQHSVRVEVEDQSAFVRVDTLGLLQQSRVWQVTVVDFLPDLAVESIQVSNLMPLAGDLVTLTSTLRNEGLAASPACKVDFFLGPEPPADADDSYLGSVELPALQPGQSQELTYESVRIPYGTEPGIQVITAQVDFDGAVDELNETGNSLSRIVWVGLPACGAHLEFRDPLVYPTDDRTISLQDRELAHLRVTSYCDPGAPYLILLGRSGTTPGSALPGGLTLPLNLDSWSELGLSLTPSSVFVGFIGLLDQNGHADATLDLRGLPYTGADLGGHFAALIANPSFSQATGVTEAVSITVTR